MLLEFGVWGKAQHIAPLLFAEKQRGEAFGNALPLLIIPNQNQDVNAFGERLSLRDTGKITVRETNELIRIRKNIQNLKLCPSGTLFFSAGCAIIETAKWKSRQKPEESQ